MSVRHVMRAVESNLSVHFRKTSPTAPTRRPHHLSRLIATCCSLYALPAFALSSATHPSVVNYDFSAAPIPFTAYKAAGGGIPSGARFALENGALKMTNAYAGSFGIDTHVPAFDAAQYGHVYFDYKLSPGVKVNIFFRYKGIYHGAVFSGPNRVRPGSILLGNIADVKADGQWHHAHIPLADWLRVYYPTAEQLTVDEIIIGNWDNDNYLMAGMNGNGPGASWSIDNFAVTGVGPAAAKFRIKADQADDAATEAGISWSLDGGKATPIKTNQFAVNAGEGAHVLEVRSGDKPFAGYAFAVSTEAPQAGKATLRGDRLVVPIAASAGLVARDVKLKVGGRDFDVNSPQLKWYGDPGELVLDAAAAGFHWKDGESVAVHLEGGKDLMGRALPAHDATVTVQYAQHTAPPPAPRLVLGDEITGATPGQTIDFVNSGSFETSQDEWSGRADGPAIVERDSTTAATGKYSLRLTCPSNAAPFAANIATTPFDAARYPIISFDYKVPPTLRVDFMLTVAGSPYHVMFTDHDNNLTLLTQLSNITADNHWHHAEILLWDALKAKSPTSTSFKVDSLYIGDYKWLGNSRGLQYWIDNFRFTTRIPSNKLQARVDLDDITGLKAIEWTLDDQPDTTPTGAAQASDKIEATGNDRRYLHVRAQNGAGQWSPVAHFSLWLGAAS